MMLETLSVAPAAAAASHREIQRKEQQCINLLAANLPLSQLIKLKCITNITLTQKYAINKAKEAIS